MTYADTSFLISLYGHDTNTAQALRAVTNRGVSIAFTLLNDFEFRNATRLLVFRAKIDSNSASEMRAAVDADLIAGLLSWTECDLETVYRCGERLSDLHTQSDGSRCLDILHVATALELGATEFLSFDARQRNLASKASLVVGP